jgi:hypothetical protein
MQSAAKCVRHDGAHNNCFFSATGHKPLHCGRRACAFFLTGRRQTGKLGVLYLLGHCIQIKNK